MSTDPNDFFRKYALVRSTEVASETTAGDAVCRYCQRTRPEVRFRQRTHVLPELLGRNDSLIFDECDTCNQQLSRYEKHLSTLLLPYRAMLGVRGKRRLPQFRSRPIPGVESSVMEAGHQLGTGLQLTVRTPSDYVVDIERRRGALTFRVPEFIPLHVYKALLKIGLGLLPSEQIEAHRCSFNWLTGKQDELTFSPLAFITPIYHRYFTGPAAYLFKAKSLVIGKTEYPEYTLVIESANVIIQIFLPFTAVLLSIHQKHRTMALPVYPGFARDKPVPGSTWEIKPHDLSLKVPVTYDVVMNFAFDSITREAHG